MTTATLEPRAERDAMAAFQTACLNHMNAHPGDSGVHDAILDLYLETIRRLEKGWSVKSVLTNSLIRLSHL